MALDPEFELRRVEHYATKAAAPTLTRPTNAAAVNSGYIAPMFGGGTFGASMLLMPLMMFYLLWPNWGTALYGEVRGASDFRRVFGGMFVACGPPCWCPSRFCCCSPRPSAGRST